MERRRSKRIVVMLEAEIISRTQSYQGYLESDIDSSDVHVYTYAGTIENISEHGMLITVSGIANVNLFIGERLEIAFQLPSGERLNLNCMVRRLQDTINPQDTEQKIGMEIIDPPPVFTEYMRAILDQSEQ